jgi:hypothetical protein
MLRLIPTSDANLFIFCGISPKYLIPYPPRFERRFPRPCHLVPGLLERRDFEKLVKYSGAPQ